MQNINPKMILNNVLNKNNTEIIEYDRKILDDYVEKYNSHPKFNSNLINNSVKYINEIDDYNNKLYQKNITELKNKNIIKEKSKEFTDHLYETFNNTITIKLNYNYIYKTIVVVLLIIIFIYLYKIYTKICLDKKIHYNYLGF